MELKIICDCGQKYKFDVEPVNSQMPFTVSCPICKRDGTAQANAMLQQMAVFRPIGAAPAPVAPPPASIAPMAPPLPATGAPRLRINATAHTEPAAPMAVAPPPIVSAESSAPPPIGARPRLGAAPAAIENQPGKKPSFAMGLLGGLIGAFVGGVLYFIIYKTTGVRIFLALGVGALAGVSAQWLGKGEGSKELGGITAVFTVVAVLGAQYFVALDRWHGHNGITEEISKAIEDGGYSEMVKESKQIIVAIPNGTDPEIRMYLAKQQAEDGQAPKLESVSNDEVKQFRDNELTNYQDLASGKLTKEQYWAKNGFDPKEAKKVADDDESTFKGLFMLLTFTRAGIFSLIAGAGLAFKLSSNA